MPVTCPLDQYRKSLAVYYLIDPLHDVDARGRPFSPTITQQNDAEVLELIKRRADIDKAKLVYKT